MAQVLDTQKATIRSADGTLIWAAAAGQSPSAATTIVFVPGFGCSSLAFAKQFEDETLLSKFSLITYEPRGQARSGHPLEKEAYSSERNAEDFKAVCDTFGAKRVVVAGWSYGGLIPCDVFAHLGPDWISGIILLAGIPWRSMHTEIAHPAVFEFVAPLLTEDHVAQIQGFGPFIDSCFYPPNLESLSYTERAAMVGAIAEQHPTARMLLMTERHQDPAKLLEHAETLPVFLIMGEHDRHMYWDKLDPFVRKTFANSKFFLVKEAGHAAFWEKPEQVNVAITEYLDSI
ncbi:alpha/beta-hydrolase [Thozetella sp. PMI_491]|nr:alpha/beta-hydrolase [Thozetella sp. PMI_491]